MVAEGEGGMLFIKRRFRITMRQSEFFTCEQPARQERFLAEKRPGAGGDPPRPRG